MLLAFGEGKGFAFGDVVAVPFGDFNDVVAGAGDDGLAAEAGVKLLVGGHVHAVDFFVLGFTDAGVAFLDPEVAGGAGACSAAGMVEEDVEVFRDVEEAHGLSVVVVGQCAVLELDGFAFGLEGVADEFFGWDGLGVGHGDLSLGAASRKLARAAFVKFEGLERHPSGAKARSNPLIVRHG